MNTALLITVTIVLLLALAILSTVNQRREQFEEPGFFGRVRNAVVGVPATIPPRPVPTVVIDKTAYPVCQDLRRLPTPDKYGRRWGWENNKSCVALSAPTAPKATAAPKSASETLVVDGVKYPRCTRASRGRFTYGSRHGNSGVRFSVEADGKACVDPPVMTTYNGKPFTRCWNIRGPHYKDKEGNAIFHGKNGGPKCIVPSNMVVVEGSLKPRCKSVKSITQFDKFGNRYGKEDGKPCGLPPDTVQLDGTIYTLCRRAEGPFKQTKSGSKIAQEKEDGTVCAVTVPSMKIDGKGYRICQDPKNATTTGKYGHKYGTENGRECVVPSRTKYTGTPFPVPQRYTGTPFPVPQRYTGTPFPVPHRYTGTPFPTPKYVKTSAPVPAKVATKVIDGKEYPVCRDLSKLPPPDKYGRQWGWENQTSCVYTKN